MPVDASGIREEIRIPAGDSYVVGDFESPQKPQAVVVFAHGSGSSRLSTRNRSVAETLRRSGRFATLLFDLLTPAEDSVYANRFDIPLLADRLVKATDALEATVHLGDVRLGYFGASTGAAAAIVAAVRSPEKVHAVVSRGGRPDLAGEALGKLEVPTLLIVGGADHQVIDLNQQALARIPVAERRLAIVPGATHLFEEPGTLGRAAELALGWFETYL